MLSEVKSRQYGQRRRLRKRMRSPFAGGTWRVVNAQAARVGTAEEREARPDLIILRVVTWSRRMALAHRRKIRPGTELLTLHLQRELEASVSGHTVRIGPPYKFGNASTDNHRLNRLNSCFYHHYPHLPPTK